jgi:hypothetical protein
MGMCRRAADRSKPRIPDIVVPLALACLALGGCGDGVPYKHGTARGIVTIDGVPVPKGTITFSPNGPGQGPVTGAVIVDGRYVCGKIPLGPHTVSFHAEAAKPIEMLDVSTGVMRSVPENILPERYRSGVPAEIHAGENALDFALERAAAE